MCRHIAYLGEPVTVASLLIEPESGLLRQSWAPREQKYGTVNADGFGIGWYVDGDPTPARYRRNVPMWTDPFVRDLGRVVRTGNLLAAVRDATIGMTNSEGAAAPFTAGPYLFSHNGSVAGWPEAMAALTTVVPRTNLLTLDAPTDSALLWALVQQKLTDRTLPEALADVTRLASSIGGRLNMLATDGSSIAAVSWGDTLYYRELATGVVVASEPYDDAPGWCPVEDRRVLTATHNGVKIEPL